MSLWLLLISGVLFHTASHAAMVSLAIRRHVFSSWQWLFSFPFSFNAGLRYLIFKLFHPSLLLGYQVEVHDDRQLL